MGGAVVLEVGGGVRVGAVAEGARHASVAGGVVLVRIMQQGAARARTARAGRAAPVGVGDRGGDRGGTGGRGQWK